MLPRKNRLPRPLFEAAVRQSKKIEGEHFSLRVSYKTAEPSRFGAVIGSKVAKKAVERNLLRRRIYYVLGKLQFSRPVEVIIYAKKGSADLDFKAINKEISEISNRI